MRKFSTKLKRSLIIALCAIIVISISMFVLTPEVAAASETPITETKETETTTDTLNKDDALALARAIAIDEAKVEAENAVKELIINEEKAQQTEQTVETQPETVAAQSAVTDESTSSGSNTSTTQSSSYVAGSSGAGYLLDIDNPDPNYTSYSICLSDYDRDLAERIVMGEAGSTGYVGMALVAQSLRDAFVKSGYSNIAAVTSAYGYSGSTSIPASSTCKEVINYIFDQGGSAVQHRIIVFYASNYCSSSWHESQDYVCSYGYLRFFDTWY